MNVQIFRQNAVPVYNFLSFITHNSQNVSASTPPRILDCGAGGILPPLAVFYQSGFDCWGVDISSTALERAREFCQKNNYNINLQIGDMKKLPFPDENFDYVYENYAMCHLNKSETRKAITEMKRVLKKDGYAFLGVISMDTWPILGKKTASGEYLQAEDGVEVNHTYFTDLEANQLVNDWKIIHKEKRIQSRPQTSNKISKNEWENMYNELDDNISKEEWLKLYDSRQELCCYSHIHYILQK